MRQKKPRPARAASPDPDSSAVQQDPLAAETVRIDPSRLSGVDRDACDALRTLESCLQATAINRDRSGPSAFTLAKSAVGASIVLAEWVRNNLPDMDPDPVLVVTSALYDAAKFGSGYSSGLQAARMATILRAIRSELEERAKASAGRRAGHSCGKPHRRESSRADGILDIGSSLLSLLARYPDESVGDVAAMVGVSRSTVYRMSKCDDEIGELLRRALQARSARKDGAVQDHHDDDS